MFEKRKRRSEINLQLAALIDAFTIIIFFLVKGTYLGSISPILPKGMELPVSSSKEPSQITDTVTLNGKTVIFQIISKELPLDAIIEGKENLLKGIRDELSQAIKSRSIDQNLISFYADRRANYKDIYPVIQFMRQAGFQSIIFLTEGES